MGLLYLLLQGRSNKKVTVSTPAAPGVSIARLFFLVPGNYPEDLAPRRGVILNTCLSVICTDIILISAATINVNNVTRKKMRWDSV
jgi:hypothetical protein